LHVLNTYEFLYGTQVTLAGVLSHAFCMS